MAGLARTRPPAPLPYTFGVDGARYTLADRPARWWMRVLSAEPPGCWWQIVPAGLSGSAPQELVRRLTDPEDTFDLDDAEALAEQVVEDVLGIGLYPAQRLLRSAYANWLSLEAWCISKGAGDLINGHPSRLCSAVYSWRLAMCEKKSDLARLDNEVFAAAPSRHASGRLRDPGKARGWDEQAESAAFMAAMNSKG